MATALYALPMQSCRVLLLLYLCLSVDSISFRINDGMPGLANYILLRKDVVLPPGDSTPNNLDSYFTVHQAIYKGAVPIWDSQTGKLTDFSTHFTFRFDTRHATTYGGGFAFFFAPIGFQIPPDSGGGNVGLHSKLSGNSRHSQIVHVVFEAGLNNGGYPTFEHVGINVNSVSSSKYTPWDASLHSGDIADVWIFYNSNTKNLSVSWEYKFTTSFSSSESRFLSYQIDLREVLPSQAMVGFSATTGMYSEEPSISLWEFESSLNMKKRSKNIIVVVASTVSVGGALIIMTAFALWRLMKNKLRKREPVRNNEGGDGTVGTNS